MTVEIPKRLTGKVAVVTGAGHGIGRASAHRMGREGARVAVVDRREQAAQETVAILKKDGINAVAWTCDVSRQEEVEKTVAAVVGHFERIDILHNNAGVVIAGSVHTIKIEDWDRVFAVNVRGILLVSRSVIPIMQRQGGGAIVNTASISGIVGEPHLAAYNASKGAVINLTRQMAVDYARDGIRCNCVCPGWIDTGHGSVRPKDDRQHPAGRVGRPDDVAALAYFLISSESEFITGQNYVIDGGMTKKMIYVD